jgi:hypothetical protein
MGNAGDTNGGQKARDFSVGVPLGRSTGGALSTKGTVRLEARQGGGIGPNKGPGIEIHASAGS